MQTQPIPAGYHTVTPYLAVDDAVLLPTPTPQPPDL